jgi:predicted heme/steroid binding protein
MRKLLLLFLILVLSTSTLLLADSIRTLEQIDVASLNLREFEGGYKLFSLKGLSRYDGSRNTPVYAAAVGKVYDFTGLRRWAGGSHMRQHSSGEELTSDLLRDSPHGPARLDLGEPIALLVFTVEEIREHEADSSKKTYSPMGGKVYDVSDGPENALIVGISAFTPSELLIFDGLEDRKSLIAIEGKVYDVTLSESWADLSVTIGTLKPGHDITKEIAEHPVSPDYFENVEVVGLLVFDYDELARFSGVAGAKAYVASGGIVYDISGIDSALSLAGTDITGKIDEDDFLADIIDSSPAIGFMINE